MQLNRLNNSFNLNTMMPMNNMGNRLNNNNNIDNSMMVNNNMKANETKDVDVPQFVGMMYDEIQKDKSYKFKFDIEAEYRNDKPLNVSAASQSAMERRR